MSERPHRDESGCGTMPTTLLDTHPRLGLAQLGAYHEQDFTGEYAGRRVTETLSVRYERGTCCICGALERRHTLVDRVLVGPNKGLRETTYWYKRECDHGSGMSNYRRPW